MGVSLFTYCQERYPALLEQWDVERNGALTPHDLSFGSHTKAWWRCARGHEWQAAVYSRTGGSGCPYCTNRRVLPEEMGLAARYPELVSEWYAEKNAPLTPDEVAPGSHKKVWWRCEKGHEWRAEIKSRTQGNGCPVCANRVIRPGENDLATTHPLLAAEWHPAKNGALTPESVFAGSIRKVWWRCEKGHEWRATIASRSGAAKNGCPVCAGKAVLPGFNDLLTTCPTVAAEWDGAKNAPLTAAEVTACSNKKFWWRCPLGHSYAAEVRARTAQGSGCPYCAGRRVLAGFNDLATLEPKVAAQWHPTLNGTLTSAGVTCGTNRKVWWICGEGHVWQATVSSRAGPQKCGCPACAGYGRSRNRTLRYERIVKEREPRAVGESPRASSA